MSSTARSRTRLKLIFGGAKKKLPNATDCLWGWLTPARLCPNRGGPPRKVLQPLTAHRPSELWKPVIFPPGRAQACDEAVTDMVGDDHKYDGDRPCLPLQCSGHRGSECEDQVRLQVNHDATFRPSVTGCCHFKLLLPISAKRMSNYPPAEPGALGCEPLEAADGVADAAPVNGGHLKVASQRHRFICSRRLSSSSCFLM